MMKSILLCIMMLSFTNAAFCKENWQLELDNVQVPEYFTNSSPVYLEYIECVKGFKVTGKFFPFDSRSETGQVILHFEKSSTGESYFYINREEDIYTSADLYDIAYAEDFCGYKAGNIYRFHYTGPQHKKNRESSYPADELHPLGYCTPFQILDIDFDGRTELIINQWDQMRGGNSYEVFGMKDNELTRIFYEPFLSLSNDCRIDPAKKTITVMVIDGVFEHVEITYKRYRGKAAEDYIYSVRCWMTEAFLRKKQHPSFGIISIYEKVDGKEYRRK